MQHAPPSFVRPIEELLLLLPDETIHAPYEAFLPRLEDQVAGFHDGVLHMRGNDLEVFLVESRKLQKIHRASPGCAICLPVLLGALTLLRNRKSAGQSRSDRDALDNRAAAGKFLLQPFESPVEMIDAIDLRLPFCCKTGNNERY